jgi:hypothetical protein
MGTLVSGFFFPSLYLQHVLGHSAVRTGVEFLPIAVGIVVAAHAGGQLIARLGAKPVIAAGLALGTAGALLLSRLSPEGSYQANILPGFLSLAAGTGLVLVGVTITAMSGAGQHETGLRSGLTSTAHELGIALVLAVLTTIAAGQLGGEALQTAATADAREFTAGLAAAFRTAAGITGAGTLLTLIALRRSDGALGLRPGSISH